MTQTNPDESKYTMDRLSCFIGCHDAELAERVIASALALPEVDRVERAVRKGPDSEGDHDARVYVTKAEDEYKVRMELEMMWWDEYEDGDVYIFA